MVSHSVQRSPLRCHDRSHFYKYVSAQTAKVILETRRLRWSSPIIFNDPFDVPRELDTGFSPRELQEEIVRLFVELSENSAPLPPTVMGLLLTMLRADPRSDVRAAIVQSLRDEVVSGRGVRDTVFEQFQSAWREMVPRLRILCLSEVCDSVPMWAHYADQHRGVVFRLECLDELDSSTLLAKPVKYQADPPRLPPKDYWARTMLNLEEVDWQHFFEQYHYVKAPDWSYEREWRTITYAREHENGHSSDSAFHPRELSEVLLGSDASQETATELGGLLAGDLSHVRLRRAKLRRAERTLSFDTISRAG